MKLVAIVRAPTQAEEAAAAVAEATGLTLAEGRLRLAPEPPALLARLEPAAADALVARLRSAGLSVLAIDADVPTDGARLIAHRLSFTPQGVAFAPRFGDAMELPWPEIAAVLRGARETTSVTARSERTTKLSVGMALATGGLKVTRAQTTTSVSSESAFQQVILVYARDGRAAAVIEGEVDFTSLGAALQPSALGNMNAIAIRLRERATGAFHDDRLLRLGRRALPFVAGGEARTGAGATTVTRRDTAASLDVLAEVLHQAVARGLLP